MRPSDKVMAAVFHDEEARSDGAPARGGQVAADIARCLPALAPFRLPLRIVLTVLSHASWARLESSLVQTSGYLGYDRPRAREDSSHCVAIWSGIAGETDTWPER